MKKLILSMVLVATMVANGFSYYDYNTVGGDYQSWSQTSGSAHVKTENSTTGLGGTFYTSPFINPGNPGHFHIDGDVTASNGCWAEIYVKDRSGSISNHLNPTYGSYLINSGRVYNTPKRYIIAPTFNLPSYIEYAEFELHALVSDRSFASAEVGIWW